MAGDRRPHVAAIDVRGVGGRREIHRAAGRASGNVDHRAVGQGHGHRSAGRIAQGRGVGDLATFADGIAGSQGQCGCVDGVVDRGADRGLADVEFLEVAAAGIGHGYGELADVLVDVIARCGNRHRTAGLAGFDGDGLAIAQVDGHRRLRGVGQRCGVSDRRAFEHIAFCAEGQVRGVDRVGNIGHRRRSIRHQIFEVATGGVLDGHFDFAGVFVDVVGRCRNGHGAGGLAGFNGDDRTVAQIDGYRRAGRVAQRRGVGDLPAFVDVAGGSQRDAGGVDGVGDSGADRGLVGDQILVVAAADVGDRVGQWCVTDLHVIRYRGGNAAGGLADGDGDVLAVGQGHDYWRAGDGRADSGGVGDGAAFSDRGVGGQFDRRGIDGVGDLSDRWRGTRNEVLEVAAGGAGDGGLHGAGVFVDVVERSREAHITAGFACLDGDDGAVRQGHGHWRASSIGQGCGVSDLAAFSHGSGRAQRQIGGVGHVGDGGRNWSFVRHQIFVVATAYASDRVGQRSVAGQGIVRCGVGDGAGGLADGDGDVLTIGQRHDHRRAGDWRADGGGVSHGAAFGNRGVCGQLHRRGIDGVSDFGHSWSSVRHQIFEVAAGGVLDADFDLAGVFVDVIGRRWNANGARGFAGINGDHRAVAQGHGYRGAGRIRQRGGVGDLATLGHGTGGAEAQASVIHRIGNRGDRRRVAWHQVFEVATGSASDRGADGAAIVVDVIGRSRHVDGANGFASRNGDGRTVRQSDGYRGLCRIGQCRGVSDLTAFNDVIGRSQGQAGVVDRIGDRRDRRRVAWHQVFKVAAGSASDRGADGAAIVVDVVDRSRHVDGAHGFASSNGDGRAVGQSDSYRGLRRIGQCRGVSDLTAFNDVIGRSQGQAGVVDRIGDRRDRRRVAWHQVFKVAAGSASDRGADGAAIVVDVVDRSRHVDGAHGFACRNGDGRTVGQGDGNRRLRRVGQCRGVSDLTAFNNVVGRSQGQAGVVDRICDGGNGWCGVRHQVFEVATGSASDRGADGAAIVVDVVDRSRHVDGAHGFASSNGDGRTVGQGDGYRRLRWISQCRCVGDLAAFDDVVGRGQREAGVINRVCDGGNGWCRVRHQIFEVAAGSPGDRGRNGAAIVVNVIGWGRHVDGAGSLASANGNGRAIRQRDGDRSLRRVSQRRGVGNLAAFGHARTSRQRDGSGVDGVGDLRGRRDSRRGHGDAVAAAGASDGHVDLARVVVDRVVRCQRHVDGAGGGAGGNDDDCAVGQGDSQVGQRRLGQGRGVHQHAAGFGDGRRGAEAQGRVTLCVGGGVGGQAARGVLRDLPGRIDARRREANGRIYAASGGVEHDEAVTAAGSTTGTCGGRAGRGGLECGGRVDTGGDGLLQFFYRRRSLRRGFGQVSAGVRRAGAPLGVTAQIEHAAIGQFQRHRAGQTGIDLVADIQAIAFNEYATHALWGHHENLTDNAFDDGNNTAH